MRKLPIFASRRGEYSDPAFFGFETGERRTLQLAHAFGRPTARWKQFSELIDAALMIAAYAEHGSIHDLGEMRLLATGHEIRARLLVLPPSEQPERSRPLLPL